MMIKRNSNAYTSEWMNCNTTSTQREVQSALEEEHDDLLICTMFPGS